MVCIPTVPSSCVDEIGEVAGEISDIPGDLAGSAADAFFQMMADGARDLLGTVSTFWMKVPSPEVASGSGQNWTGAESITSIQAWISPVAFVIFVVSMGLVLLKIANDTRRAGEGFNAIVRSLVVTLAGGLPLLAFTMLLIQAGDEFSPWVLEQASGEDTSEGFGAFFVAAMMGGPTTQVAASGGLLVIYLLAILGAIAQVFFMIVRGASIIVLLSFAQVTAAGTATEEGWLRFKRICMLVIGFALYKPVAAVIYGVGLKLMSDGATTADQMMNAIFGLTVMVMAALALPAVIKFVAPSAALGSSSAFSGGAAVGVVATGAAVVALAGTGGGSAAAGAAGGGSGGVGGWGNGNSGKSPGASDPPGANDSPAPSGADTAAGKKDSGADRDADAAPVGSGRGTQGAPEGAGQSPAGGDTPSAPAAPAGAGSGEASTGDTPLAPAAPAGADSGEASTGDTPDGGQGRADGSSGQQGAASTPPDRSGSSPAAGAGGGAGGSKSDSAGGSAVQAGAQTVQNVTGQLNQAGEDASRE